jgi:hypothetical protein
MSIPTTEQIIGFIIGTIIYWVSKYLIDKHLYDTFYMKNGSKIKVSKSISAETRKQIMKF